MTKKNKILRWSFMLLIIMMGGLAHPWQGQALEVIYKDEIAGEWTAMATLLENTMGDIEHSELKSFQNEEGMTSLQVETTLEKYEPMETMEVTLWINEDGSGYPSFPNHDETDGSFNRTASSLTLGEDGSLMAYSSGWYTDRDLIMVSAMKFEGNVSIQGNEMIIQGKITETLEGVEGNVVYSWTASKEILSGGAPIGEEKPSDEKEIPVLTGPEEPKVPVLSTPTGHTGPLATALISVVAGVAGLIGAAIGFASPIDKDVMEEDIENPMASEELDPAYEKNRVPNYPDYVMGEDGERLSRNPDGLIQASFPNGDQVTYFPNGTVQRRDAEGVTWEQWPDGTVSTSVEGQFIVKEPDGTMTVKEPTGEEIRYNTDGTRVETDITGMRKTMDQDNNIVLVEYKGFSTTKHPTEPDTLIMTSPTQGSLIIREKSRIENYRANGKWQRRTVTDQIYEGELKIDGYTITYKPDGSIVSTNEEGEMFHKHADGSIEASSPDGLT